MRWSINIQHIKINSIVKVKQIHNKIFLKLQLTVYNKIHISLIPYKIPSKTNNNNNNKIKTNIKIAIKSQ